MKQEFKTKVVGTKLFVTAISRLQNLSLMEKEIDAFIESHTANPFMLTSFLKEHMCWAVSNKCTPIVLIIKADEKIVGVATLVLKRVDGTLRFLLRSQLGAYSAESLFRFSRSPDFVLDDDYREESLQCVLSFVFNTVGCRFATEYFPFDTPNLHLLASKCEDDRISLRTTSEATIGYRFIPVNSDWDSFQSSRGSNFRHKFKKMERNLSVAGISNTLLFENAAAVKDVLQKILEVDEASWKPKDQTSERANELGLFWDAASTAYRTYSGFKFFVWLLELNGNPIAYCIGCQYKETAYLVKTSFDDKWRTLFPGIYIMNLAIRDFFRNGDVKAISFMTNLPFTETWASLYAPRIKVLMSCGTLPGLCEFLAQNKGFQLLFRLARSRYLRYLPHIGQSILELWDQIPVKTSN